MAPGQLETSRFLVTLCNRRQVVDMTNMDDAMDGMDNSDQEVTALGGSGFER